MKLSDLIKKLEKAVAKYGDMPVGIYPKSDARDIDFCEELYEIGAFRVINEKALTLPGVSVDEEENDVDEEENERHKSADSVDSNYFAAIFYED